jgi:hypothetical protein
MNASVAGSTTSQQDRRVEPDCRCIARQEGAGELQCVEYDRPLLVVGEIINERESREIEEHGEVPLQVGSGPDSRRKEYH